MCSIIDLSWVDEDFGVLIYRFSLTSESFFGIRMAVLRASQRTICLSTTLKTVYKNDEKYKPYSAFLIRAD